MSKTWASVPHAHICWTPPKMMTPPFPWAVVPMYYHSFRVKIFPNIQPEWGILCPKQGYHESALCVQQGKETRLVLQNLPRVQLSLVMVLNPTSHWICTWGHCNGNAGPKEFRHPNRKAQIFATITAHRSLKCLWQDLQIARYTISDQLCKQGRVHCSPQGKAAVWPAHPLQTHK